MFKTVHDLAPAFGTCEPGKVFLKWREWNHSADANKPTGWVGHYCIVGRDHEAFGLPHSLYVEVTPEALQWIKDNLLHIEYDRIYFELVAFDDGTAVIWAKYNKIIGEYKLAEVSVDEIKKGLANG